MSLPTLYPQFESSIPPLDESDKYRQIIKLEKDFVAGLKENVSNKNLLNDCDKSIIPPELISDSRKPSKPKVDPLKRLKELPTEEADEEEESDDEEEEDEETAPEDEEDDAGGDYIVSHFDNGEGYEDNDDEGEPGELAS